MKLPARFKLLAFCLLTVFFASSNLAFAFTSSSSNFTVNGEFGDFGGAKASANYNVTDTGGGLAVGFGNSTNFQNCSGFQCNLAQVPSIVFSLSTNSLSLGTLTSSAINVQSQTLTVTTNFHGYSVSVVEDDNLCRKALPCNSANDIDAISPSPHTLSAGVEAYGLATSQSGQNINHYSPSCSSASQFSALTTSPQTVASKTSATTTSGEQTTICYAATASGSTAAGTYTQKLTFIATGKF